MPEHEDDVALDTIIRTAGEAEMPAELEARLRRRLDEFHTRVAARPVRRFAWLAMWPRVVAAVATVAVIAAIVLVLLPGGTDSSRAYAAAVQGLRATGALEYSIVFHAEPYVGIDFSFQSPGMERFVCSWGIEVRANHNTGQQLVLMHGARSYVVEQGKAEAAVEGSAGLLEQLRSLPAQADEVLGERREEGRRLLGYRLRKAPAGATFHAEGLKSLELWVDAATNQAARVDFHVAEPGKPAATISIQKIRAGGTIDPALFDMTPPEGYRALVVNGEVAAGGVEAQVSDGEELNLVVLPMKGGYEQAGAAVAQVKRYLDEHGVAPSGAPLGRFWSVKRWEAGYPVPAGTKAEAPFEAVKVPAGLVAKGEAKGAWGGDSSTRWVVLLRSATAQGYEPAGPAMETWKGAESNPESQATELRIPVKKAK